MTHLLSRKLNLGCGPDVRAGYVNVDLHGHTGPDVVADVLDLRDFPSNYYEEILALGLIEHFKRTDSCRALYEWNRLLVPGGRLELSTTYLNGLARKLEAPTLQTVVGQETIMATLFAGQDGDGDYHLTAFSELLLRYYLWECGFDIDDIGLLDGWLFQVVAHKARDCSFAHLLGEPDDDAFLAAAYREILHRDPDPVGLAHFGAVLAGGQLTRPGVIKKLLLCPERKQTMTARAPRFSRAFDPNVALEDGPRRTPWQSLITLGRRVARRLLRGRGTGRREVV